MCPRPFLLLTRLWTEPCYIWITPTISPMSAAWASFARPTCLPTQPSVASEDLKEWWLLSAGWVTLLRNVACHLRRYGSSDTFQGCGGFEQALRTGYNHRKLLSTRTFGSFFCIFAKFSGIANYLYNSYVTAWIIFCFIKFPQEPQLWNICLKDKYF